MATEQKPHFLLIPYSEQGHINPMLSLASHLLRLGCLVTFVKADRHLPPPSASDNATTGTLSTAAADPAAAHEGPQLRFVTLPVRNKAMCVDVKTMTRFQIFKNTMAGLEDRQDLIAAIIEESKASSHPITCIICDILLWKWIRHIARLHPQLRSAALCVVSAISFYTRYLEAFDKGAPHTHVGAVVRVGLPGSSFLGPHLAGCAAVSFGEAHDDIIVGKM